MIRCTSDYPEGSCSQGEARLLMWQETLPSRGRLESRIAHALRPLFTAGIVLVGLSFFSGAAGAQQHPNGVRGFLPDKTYHLTDIDQVSLYNGNLTATIPIGGAFPLDGGRLDRGGHRPTSIFILCRRA